LATAALIVVVSGSVSAQEAKPIRIGLLDNPVILPVLLAEQGSLFEKVGLDAEIVYFDSGPAIGQALSGGSLDVGFLGGALPLFASRGAGTAVVVTSLEEDSVEVIARPGIDSLEALKGQPIAFTAGTSAQVVLHYALKSVGLTFDDVRMVNAPPPGAVSAFAAGEVAAAVLFPPFSLRAVEAQQGAKAIASGGDFSPDTAFFNGYLANRNLLASDRDTVVRFVAAMILANATINDDYAAAAAQAYQLRFTNIDRPTYDAMLGSFSFPANEWWQSTMTNGEIYDRADRLMTGFSEIGVIEDAAPSRDWLDASVYADALELVADID
jgi:NitT/TauT family transport system substrate-binding protein